MCHFNHAPGTGLFVSQSSTLVQNEISHIIGWIAITFGRNIRGSQQRMNPNDLGDPLTFLLTPPWLEVLSEIF